MSVTSRSVVRQEALFDLAAIEIKRKTIKKAGGPRVVGTGNMRLTTPSQRSKAKKIEKYRAQDRIRAQRNYKAASKWFRNLKESHGCSLCDERFHASLDFHHIDRGTKKFLVSTQNVCRSRSAFLAEMAKCILLCKNCHTKVEHGGLDISMLQPFDAYAVSASCLEVEEVSA